MRVALPAGPYILLKVSGMVASWLSGMAHGLSKTEETSDGVRYLWRSETSAMRSVHPAEGLRDSRVVNGWNAS